MDFNNKEKLFLTLLCDIHKKLGVDNGINSEFIQNALYTDNTWAISWEFSGIFFESEPTPQYVQEVVDILDMWHFIEISYDSLSPDDKEEVKEKAEPFGTHVKFAGFDGNNEAEHLSAARFLIEDMHRFEYFKGRNLNSHSYSLEPYLRMYKAFKPMRSGLAKGLLSASQITKILLAKKAIDA